MVEQVRERGIFKEYVLWLLKLVTIVGIFLFALPALIAAVMFASDPSLVEAPLGGKHLVAVVEMKGAIESSKEVLEDLHKHAGDDKVKGIVLRIDSPGGAVAPSQDIYRAVMRLKAKKPIVVSMGSLAASGGLYSALGASKVYAEPGTITGSIGVIMTVPNFTHIAERFGFDMITVKSGKLKDIGNSFRAMTDEERQLLETQLGEVHGQFIDAVAEGRKLEVAKVREFADGRAIMGSEAKRLGLVDEFGDVYDAARAVFELLGEPLKGDEQPRLIYSKDKFEELRELLKTVGRIPALLSPTAELRFEMR
jgi:protease-4